MKKLFQGKYEKYTECANEICTDRSYLTSDDHTDLNDLYLYVGESTRAFSLKNMVENFQKPSYYNVSINSVK